MKAKSFMILLAAASLLAACSSPAKLGYLRDMEYNTAYHAQKAPELKIQTNDNLSIHVYSTADELLAVPFNMGATEAYVVDYDGNIDFPVLGKIYVEGLTINQVKEELAHRINTSGYMKNPVINIRLNNFTITVLGETGKSVMPVPDNRINILQVIASSGGTTTASKIRDVMVIRTENDERMAYSLNLQSKDIFDSPVFYLQQNDIVYVKPQGLQFSATGETVIRAIETVFSFITSVAYASWWLRR